MRSILCAVGFCFTLLAQQPKVDEGTLRAHRPTDCYHPEWNLKGLVQQVRFALELGRFGGNGPEAPLILQLGPHL